MALIIEDGTGVSGATSYATLAQIRAFATARGVTSVPTVDADAEVLAIKAMDYLEGLRGRYQGSKSDAAQALQFPRYGLYLDGSPVDADTIPAELLNAQCELAIAAITTDLAPQGDGRVVTKEQVGPLVTEYAGGGSGAPQPVLPAARRWLDPLLKNAGQLTTVKRG